jgi:hypothetical protein
MALLSILRRLTRGDFRTEEKTVALPSDGLLPLLVVRCSRVKIAGAGSR